MYRHFSGFMSQFLSNRPRTVARIFRVVEKFKDLEKKLYKLFIHSYIR